MIPRPSLERLTNLTSIIEDLFEDGVEKTSSSELEQLSGISSLTIRKDISFLGAVGATGSGYNVAELLGFLKENLGININRNCCVVGLGKLGCSILNYDGFFKKGFNIVAGFDNSNNRIETLEIDIPLYPAYEIEEVVNQKKIEIAILTVPASAAQKCAERLERGGIKAILNFAPTKLNVSEKIIVENLMVAEKLRFLSSLINNATHKEI